MTSTNPNQPAASGSLLLEQQPLAFSSDATLRAASSRLGVETSDGALLNVEFFEYDNHDDAAVLLFVIPGVCESIETKGVQAIVAAAATTQFAGTIAVLELEGHGLSSGRRAYCPSLDRLVQHAVEALHQTLQRRFSSTHEHVSVYLTGNSLGGAIAIAMAQQLSTTTTTTSKSSQNPRMTIQGVAPIAPAVGMNPQMLPPSPIVYGLKALAFLMPTSPLSLTPYEDPTHYNLPSTTTRNYQGNWPLATSKMLLEVTSQKIPHQIRQGHWSLSQIPSVLVIAGEKDFVVPIEAIELFLDRVEAPHKQFQPLKKAGHDLLFEPKSSATVVQLLFEWIQQQQQQESKKP